MTSRYNVIMNSLTLSGQDASILVTDISHAPVSMSTDAISVAKRQGAIVQRRYVDKCSVTVSFQIRKYDIAERQAVCSKVANVVKGDITLQTNDRPGLKLECICESMPVISSALRWTDPIQMTFSAYSIPYWQQLSVNSAAAIGETGGGTFDVPGNVPNVPCDLLIYSTGETLQRISVTVNDRTMIFNGLNLGAGQLLRLTYDNKMIQAITAGNESILDKRTGADDLLCNCGERNQYSFTANTTVRTSILPRGWWY